MIDTHAHLYDKAFAVDRPEEDVSTPIGSEAVARAINKGVCHMILPNVDIDTVSPLIALHKAYPENTSVAAGIHPTELGDDWENDIKITIERIGYEADRKMVAIGEIGVDLYWDKTNEDRQMRAFDMQCGIALELSLPVIIHCREALDQCIEVVSSHRGLKGVFHCFTGTVNDVVKVRKAGDFYFGIGGVATFKKADLGPAIQAIGLERIVLETDSPYLAPVPYRGSRNESSYLYNIRDKIASLLSIAPAAVENATDKNARCLFKLEIV